MFLLVLYLARALDFPVPVGHFPSLVLFYDVSRICTVCVILSLLALESFGDSPGVDFRILLSYVLVCILVSV